MNVFQRCWQSRTGRVLTVAGVLAVIAASGQGIRYGLPAWRNWRARSLELQCRKLRDRRDWSQLSNVAAAWTESDPSRANAWLYLADAAQQLGDFEAAAHNLAMIPESDPKALPALVSLSALQFGPLNRPLDGEKTCAVILKREPRVAAVHHRLIEFYAMTMQREKLIRQIRSAIEVSCEPPSAYIYLLLVDSMRLQNGVELNVNWLKTDPDRELFLVAAALQQPEPTSGTDAPNQDKHLKVKALSQRFPENIELLAYQADLTIRAGNVEELLAWLRRVPESADDDDRFWRAKGWLHLTRNELPKAREALDQAIKLCPLDWNARTWLAVVERREGHVAKADQLENLVRQARRLREMITGKQDLTQLSDTILRDLLRYYQQCGEQGAAEVLQRRIESHFARK